MTGAAAAIPESCDSDFPYCDFPYQVFSDDEPSLPTEIPPGRRCACVHNCLKLMAYFPDFEASQARCWECSSDQTGVPCFCLCITCEAAGCKDNHQEKTEVEGKDHHHEKTEVGRKDDHEKKKM